MVIVRDARREDCKLIYPMVGEMIKEWIKVDEWHGDGTAEGFERLLFDEKNAYAAIAFCDDKAVGYVFYTVTASSLNCMSSITMENFYVCPEYRRQGIGTKMLDFMKEKTIEDGRLGLEWFAVSMRPGDLAFFEANGSMPEMARLSYHWNNGVRPPEAVK